MDLEYLKLWVRTLINEEINKDQLASVARILGTPETDLETWVNGIDPTPNKSYSVWILRGLKKKDFRLEDGPRIATAIREHIRLRNARLIGDIMQFPKIHDLETAMAPYAQVGAKRQGYSGVDPETLPGVTILEKRPDGVTFFEVRNPESLAKMGEGTKWCTRYSFANNFDMATRYLKTQGRIIVGYNQGRPFVQYNPDFSQVMDVNDKVFHGQDAKSLNLPMPNVKFDPQRKWKISKHTGPEKILQRWQDYTQNPGNFLDRLKSANLLKRSPQFEKVLAGSITKSNNFMYQLRINDALSSYSTFLNGERIPEIENAILNKDWTEAWKYRSAGHGQHSRIPIIYGIIQYVKNAIRGNWPEFEKKYLSNDPYNAAIYYTETGLKPDNVENPSTKYIISLALDIKNGGPKLLTPEFTSQVKEAYNIAVKEFSHSKFAVIYHHVLIPYMQKTHKNLSEILGPRDARIIYKNTSMLDAITNIRQNRDPQLEKLLLTKLNNALGKHLSWYYTRTLFSWIKKYAKNIIGGRWEEFENAILNIARKVPVDPINTSKDAIREEIHQFLTYLAEYAIAIRNKSWPELRGALSGENQGVFDREIERLSGNH